MKTINVMLDLETLGNKSNSVIVAIGAVKFGDGKIVDEFYMRVCPKSAVDMGLKMDVETVLWWLQQNDDARLEICKPGTPLAGALLQFQTWLGREQVQIWGNGSDFDNVILANAFESCYMSVPWKFWNNRCFRTVKNLNPLLPYKFTKGTAHNALDDARNQALHLMEIFRAAASVREEVAK